MGKLFKFLAIFIGLIVVLIIAAIIIIPLVVNPNDYKDEITAKVKEATGRELVINGPLELSVFPWVAIHVSDATLSNAPGFSETPMMKLGEADIRVKVIPLIADKRLEMDTVVLNNLHLNLEKDAAGKTNLDDLGNKNAEAGVAKSGTDGNASEASPEAGPEAGQTGIAINGIELTESSLSYRDAQTKTHYSISGISITTGAISPGASVPFELAMAVSGKSAQASAKPIDLKIAASAELTLDTDKQLAALRQLELRVDGEAGGPKPLDLRLTGELDYQIDSADLDARELSLSLYGATVTAKLSGKQINTDAASFTGELKLEPLNLREMLVELNGSAPDSADPSTLKTVGFSTDLSATKTSASLTGLDLQLDESHLRGELTLRDFQGPGIDFNLNVDRINLDRYLPPPVEKKTGDSGADKTAGGDEKPAELPVEMLRALDINGKFTVGSLTVNKLNVQNASLTLKANNGLIKLDPVTAELYEGKVKKTASLDVRKDTPKYAVKLNLEGVQIEPLLTDMNGESPISGRTEISADVTSAGQGDAMTKNLNGKLGFKFENGAYNGVNVAYEIRRARALLKGEPEPEKTSNSTDFALMSGSGKIRNGVLDNRDLKVHAPLLRISGAGSADLAAQTADYGLTVAVVNTTKGQGGSELSDLDGLKIPTKIKGPFADPDISIDLEKLLADEAKKKAKAKIEEKIQEKIGDKLPGGIGDALKGLF